MATVRIFNPSNPRPRSLSYDQVKERQDRAVTLLENTGHPDLADKIASLSVGEDATRKGYRITDDSNPTRKELNSMRKDEDRNAAGRRAASELLELDRNAKYPGLDHGEEAPFAEVAGLLAFSTLSLA
jgi:hypothetical protein